MKKTNEKLSNLIREIKAHAGRENSGFWKRIAKELEKPTRSMRRVNISKINQYSKTGETVVVPGVVLGSGELDHDVTVVAFKFSDGATSKVKNKMSIKELLEKDPKGKIGRILC